MMKMSCSNVAAISSAAAAIQPEIVHSAYVITIPPPWNVMQGDVANGPSVRSSICLSIIVSGAELVKKLKILYNYQSYVVQMCLLGVKMPGSTNFILFLFILKFCSKHLMTLVFVATIRE